MTAARMRRDGKDSMTARVFALCLARPVADLVAAQDLPTASWSAKADIIHVILFPAPEKTRGWSAFADHDEGEERGAPPTPVNFDRSRASARPPPSFRPEPARRVGGAEKPPCRSSTPSCPAPGTSPGGSGHLRLHGPWMAGTSPAMTRGAWRGRGFSAPRLRRSGRNDGGGGAAGAALNGGRLPRTVLSSVAGKRLRLHRNTTREGVMRNPAPSPGDGKLPFQAIVSREK